MRASMRRSQIDYGRLVENALRTVVRGDSSTHPGSFGNDWDDEGAVTVSTAKARTVAHAPRVPALRGVERMAVISS